MKLNQGFLFKQAVNTVLTNRTLREIAVKQIDKYLYNNTMQMKGGQLGQEKADKYLFLTSAMHQTVKNINKGFIKPSVIRKMTATLLGDNYTPDRHSNISQVKKDYKEKYGDYPPSFLTLSPGKGCNLHCVGCYASSKSAIAEKLDFETSRKILRQAHDIFGSKFMVISGGEPFLYKSDGKDIFNLFEEFNDMFFLVYTNGTLITEAVAKKLAELGNVTPAISVEGFEKETDERRGKGVYNLIMKAMENLQTAGVLFGISVTATSKNFELLMQDEFYNHYFEKLGATYMWQFQLMPIGRGKDVVDLMITPDQRVKLYKQWGHLLKDKKYPVADFWNSGTLSSGCIAYGRWNGYFYIDWNGNIMPCVFVPYHVDNVIDLFNQGKTIADALQSKMFNNGRKWQKEYGFENKEHSGNVLMPCSIRDHYKNFKYNILTQDAKGEDAEAEAVLNDPEYEKIMTDFDDNLEKLTQQIFEERYLKELLTEQKVG